MWHEARRQERKIRGMLVDYRRRAERRRDFYEKIKADPTQFLQVHGRQCKIHLDPNVAAAADSAVMMPWQGHADNLIDRFDVRAHLDYINPIRKEDESELTQEERQLNYERYRIIAQNSFLSITEEKFLRQLHLEEQFGYTESKGKKEPRTGGAAIGFNYEDGTGVSHPLNQEQDEESDDNSDSDLDVDLAINVSKMDPTQAHEMNKHGRNFGMSSNDFYSFLTNDLEEAESYKLAKEEEQEKALFSGRRSRRERRYHREKRLANRIISPPSYAAQASPTLPLLRDSKSASRSPTPDNTGKITYITSFGDDEDPPSTSKPTYADKVKYGKPKQKREASTEKIVYRKRSRSQSRDRYNRKRVSPRKRSRSNSRSRARSNSTFKNRRTKSQSRSRSKSRSKSRRSDSRSKSRRSKSRSRSRRSISRSRGRKSRSKSRSRKRNWRSSSKSISRSRSRSKSRFVRSFRRKRSSSSSSSSSSSKSQKSKTSIDKQKSLSPERRRSVSPIREFEPIPKVLPRYYGRKRSDESSSELSDDDEQDDVEMKPAFNPVGPDSKIGHGNNSGTTTKKPSNMTVIERLKRKRQALLNRQFKADKIAEQLKTEREKQEQQTREDELREMAIRLRRRQRELRHAYDSRSSSSSDSDSSSQRSRPSESRQKDSREESKERETEGKREKTKDRRERPRSRERERSKDRGRSRDRARSRDRDRNRNRSRDKDRRDRDRDRYRDSRRDDDKRGRNSPHYRERKSDDKGERKTKALVDY